MRFSIKPQSINTTRALGIAGARMVQAQITPTPVAAAPATGGISDVNAPPAAGPAAGESETGRGLYLRIIKIEKRWNISTSEIEDVLNKVVFIGNKYVNDIDVVTTYYHETWGSCREWKLVVTDVNGNFLPGEWLDRSSTRNVRKYKFTKISDLPSQIRAYYFESPSCNKAKRFSFIVVAEVVKNGG